MPSSLIIVAILLATGLAALRIGQLSRMRRLSLQRVGLQVRDDIPALAVFLPNREVIRTYPRRYYFAPPLAAVVFAGLVLSLTNLPVPYSIAGGILIAAIAYLFEMHWADSQIERLESQLSDAIDLMVASLRAGSALLATLEATMREARQPMRRELEEMVGRIRLGEDPQTVVKELAVRIPLESFRLFSHTLLVHWETGGSLASSLKTVGKTVRDRLEVSRRISAQAVESQVSVFAVMAISYGLTLFMLNSNPGPLKKLIYSQVGSYVAAGLMILQAIGMTWIWRMSRIRF
jgi:tight adherence protein B